MEGATPSSTRSRLLKRIAIGTIVSMVLVAGVGYWLLSKRIWTDDRTINVPDHLANLREVLWTAPVPVAEANSVGHEYEPALSPDGAELYFVRGLPGSGASIHFSERRNGAWTEPRVIEAIAGDADALGPRLSPDGTLLYFYANREGGHGGYDIWASRRTEEGWGEPFNLGPGVNSAFNEYSPAPSPDGTAIYFASNRHSAPAASGPWRATVRELDATTNYDLFVARCAESKHGANANDAPPMDAPVFGDAVALDALNTEAHEGTPAVSPAGDFLYFTSNRAGGQGGFDLYRVRIRGDALVDLESLGVEVNTPANETDPHLAMGGFRLYFSSDRVAEAAADDAGDNAPYDLYWADSREVFAQRTTRDLPTLGWSWWVLLAGLALLLPLLAFLRDLDPQKLSTLQKCLLGSLMLHLLLVLFLSFVFVSQQVYQFMKQEAGMEVAVNLAIASELQVKLEAREQLSELPAAAPVMEAIARSESAMELPRIEAQATQLNVPATPVRPTSMSVTTSTAPSALPDPSPAPAPTARAASPMIEAAPPEVSFAVGPRVAEAESQPSATAAAPVALDRAADAKPPGETHARHSTLPAQPAAPSAQSLAAAPSEPAPVPMQPVAELAAASGAAVEIAPALESLDAPQAGTQPIAAAEAQPTLPVAAPAAATRTATNVAVSDAPPATVQLLATPAQATTDSLARAVDAAAAALPEGQVVAHAQSPLTEVAPIIDAAVPGDAPAPMKQAEREVNENAAPLAAAPAPARRQPEANASSPAQVADLDLPVEIARDATASLADLARVEELAPIAAPMASDPPRIDAPRTDIALDALPQIDGIASQATPRAIAELAPSATLAELPTAGPRSHASIADAVVARALEPLAPTAAMPTDRNDASLVPAGLDSLADRALAAPRLDPAFAPPLAQPIAGALGPGELSAPPSLHQRSIEQRRKMIDQFGGSEQSEDAVERALRYLARNQEPGGSWTRVTDDRPPGKRGSDRHDSAITGLAVLCFLAADHTPDKPGPYRETVERGLAFLIAKQKDDGDLRNGSDMYGQGIAALAVCEAAIMTGNPQYRAAAFRAAEFILRAQNRDTGGWRYNPGDAGDTSVFGWQIMALHSAEMLGMTLPAEARQSAMRWLGHVSQKDTVLAGYQNSNPTPAMTAEAMISRILLGEIIPPDKLDKASSYAAQQRPGVDRANYYAWYYTSLALMQAQSSAWEKWNETIRNHLVAAQVADGLHEGSWHTDSQWGERGGRIYTTAMACLTLEVYYRYLPLYRRE